MINRPKRIYLSSPHMGGTEQKYIDEAFSTNWIAPLGPNIDRFERSLSMYCRSGLVVGPGIYSDITKEDLVVHPVTGNNLFGLQIPFWEEVIDLTKEASLMIPENRSVGWDIAISNQGPELIEGNHNWCKLLWQLPVKKGMKEYLEIYM